MKACVNTRYGPPEVVHLEDVDKPVPRENEVLIRMHAATVNRTDCGFRRPEYPVIIRLVNGFFTPRNTILGTELAGEIEAVGNNVGTFRPGDRVFGLSTKKFGTHAEYICLPADASIAIMPANVSYEEAAAVCDGAYMALTYLRCVDFTTRRTILVNGASGSIGSAGVQLAKYFGAHVTAVCDTKTMDLARSLGADDVIDYTKEDFTRCGQSFDVVFDAVGKSSFLRCRRVLNPGGTYFSTELGFMGQNILWTLVTRIAGGKKLLFPLPKDTKEDVVFIKELMEAGRYKAVIDRRYTLDQIIEAHRYVESGMKTGNVVLVIEKTGPI